MNTYNKIIFVCVGNTCRSPMAATIMQNCIQGQNFNGACDESRNETEAL